MAEILILILIVSILMAALSFGKAVSLHLRIEALHPGFNLIMRELIKHRKKP